VSGTIVFDFDGTLALGAGPIVAYARALGALAGDEVYERARQEIRVFEAGGSAYRDGYHAVGVAALAAGVDPDTLHVAYETSRRELGTEAAPVEPPAGLPAFLGRLGGTARLVLATNAPAIGVPRLLRDWGVAEAFDELRFRIGKPAGLAEIVRVALARGPVLAIGDIVELDLAPAMELGADTALVGATAAGATAPVTMRGRTVTDLYPDIQTWAAIAASRTSAPEPTGADHPHESTERH